MQKQQFKDVLDNMQFIKKETLKVFSCELLQKFKDRFFHKAPSVATSFMLYKSKCENALTA